MRIVGEHFSRFYTQEDIEIGKPDSELEVAASEGRLEDEGWRVRKDGSRFWANVIITPIRDKNGTLLGFSKVTRDFTERKKAEEALRASENRFQSLFEFSPDAIVVTDPEGRNPGSQRARPGGLWLRPFRVGWAVTDRGPHS